MSLSDKTAALVQTMQAIGPLINQQLAKKVAAAAQADAAAKLGGQTPADFATSMDGELSLHTASDGHTHVQLADINVFSKTEIAAATSTRYPLAALPVSRYGELSYLPVGVSGSFEGASTFFGKTYNEARHYPGIVEDDGTYVFLRNGTTGSKFGVYYGYVKNVLNTSDLTPIRTNRKYAPAYFPSGYTAGYVGRGDLQGQCIFGRLQDSSSNYGSYFLSLTHGTFDDTKHTGCLIAASSLPSLTYNCYPEAMVGNDSVYLLFPVYDTSGQSSGGTAANPVEWAVYSIPLSSIGNGNTVTPTQITGWTCTSFNGASISSTNLRLANKTVSTSNADNPMILEDSTASSINVSIVPFYPNENGQNTFSAQNTDGNCRSRLMAEFVCYNPQTGEQPVWNAYFSFVWNPYTKTASLDTPYRGVGTVAVSNGKIVLGGPPLLQNRRPYSIANWLTGETMIYHPQGWWLSVVDQAVVDYTCYVGRAQLTGGAMGAYAALLGNTTVSNWGTAGFNAAYGSAVGGGLMGCTQLPGNKMLVFGSGRNNAGAYARDLMVVQKGADSYTYASLYFGSLTGFAPHSYRQFLTDLGLTPLNYASIISEINSAGTVTCTGAQYLQNIKDTGFLNCDSNLTLTGSTSINTALYASVTNAALSAAGVSAINSRCSIVVPQNASIPPFAYVHYIDSGKTERFLLAELSITSGARNGAISGLSVVSVSPVFTMASFVNTFVDNQQNYAYAYMGGGVSIYETSDCWLIGGQSHHFIDRVTSNGSCSYRFAVPKSNNRPQWSNAWAGGYWTTFESYFFGGVPGKGFGQYAQTNAGADGTTKLLFRPCATNLAGYNSWAEQAQSTWSVQTSQDVASGWLVYFTQQTPLILNGKRYTLAPVTVDLTAVQANPANTTFYVYATTWNGTGQYLVTPTQYAEAPDTMYLGKIVTGATAITSMTLEKVTRLGNYRFSPTARGSAMTVSNGLPSQTSTAAWT